MFKFSGYHTRTDGRSDILSAIGIAIFFRVHNTRTRFFQKKDAPRGLPKGRPHGASITVNLRNLRQIKEDLAEFGNTADTVDKSPGSNLGRRLAYTAFVQQQNALAEAAGYDECQVSFHSVMSQFRLAWSPKPTAACTPEAGGKCAEGPPTKKSKAGDATGGAEASEDHGDGNGAGDDDCENEGEEVDEETESTSGVGFLHFPPTLRVY